MYKYYVSDMLLILKECIAILCCSILQKNMARTTRKKGMSKRVRETSANIFHHLDVTSGMLDYDRNELVNIHTPI